MRLKTYLLMGFLIMSGCRENDNPAKIKKSLIRATVVGEQKTTQMRSFSGIARSAAQIPLSFRVSGKIEKFPCKVGMSIKPGDLVAALDSTDYILIVQKAEAGRSQVQMQLNRAKNEYDRDRQLYETHNISQSRLDKSFMTWQSLKEQVRVAKQSVTLAKRQLGYTRLKSPIEGAVAKLPVEIYQTVAPGQAVAMITANGKLEVLIGVPETLIGKLKKGDPAGVFFDALPGQGYQALVTEVGIQTSKSAVYPVILELKDRVDRLRPGMVAEVEMVFDNEEPFVTIPFAAVITDPVGTRFVWVYQDGKVNKREISVGKLLSEGIQVLQGLEPGEVIATRGVNRLVEGQKVRVL